MNRRHFLGGAYASLAAGHALGATQPVDLNRGTYKGARPVACPDGSVQLRINRNSRGEFGPEGEFVSEVIPTPGKPRISWTPQWITPQRYRKHPANPVYGPAQSGEWDNWTNGVGILRTADGRHYHMYYADQKNGIGFAVASISQPTVWQEHPNSPVLRPKGAPHWEGDRLNQPRMAKVTDTHWRMYYTGWGDDIWRMGLAESFDGGLTWRRHSDEPVLPLGDKGSPDSGAACVPMVLRHNGTWHMWYTATVTRAQGIHICYAVSRDGVRWEKHAGNPVLPTIRDSKFETFVVSRPCVVIEDGVFKMWYSMRGTAYRIGYAESVDGIRWERSPISPILDVSPGGWDSQMVEYPEIDVVDGVYRMWYCGNGFGTVGYTEGIAETSLRLQTRSGPSRAPDGKWSEWSTPYVSAGGEASRSSPNTYVQIRVLFRSSNPRLSPSLRSIELSQNG